MLILAIDIGTGTQDILLHNTRLDVENAYKLVVPSPTMIISRSIKRETSRGNPILLHGSIMGGGPSHWAVTDHLKHGFHVYAIPEAAKSFNDDLDIVRQSGITVVSEDEARNLPVSIARIHLADFDFATISIAFQQFGVSLNELTALALAVFDHGNSPPGYSDRQFRFDYIEERLKQKNALSAFAFKSHEIPVSMTRMKAAARLAEKLGLPVIMMDTAPAAVQGALLDENIKYQEQKIIANIGNFHSLAFLMNGTSIEGVFEHHTGLVDREKMESLFSKLADRTLKHKDIFDDHGHGAWLKNSGTAAYLNGGLPFIGLTGPRRSMMANSRMKPYFAAPFGDMMMTGSFGLLQAVAETMPELHDEIIDSLSPSKQTGHAPWESN